jgi:thiol-disulfide isomerase/thioredoxin
MIRYVRSLLYLGCALLAACKPAAEVAAPPVVAAPITAPAPVTPAASAAAKPKPEFPSLKITTFDGKPYDLAEHRGHWVVVNYWATWCTPCLAEIPDLAAFDQAREDVEVIGLAFEDIEKADMQAFLKEHPIPYPIAVLDVYNPPADFDTPPGLPMTYLIAPNGKVAKQFLGPTNARELEKLIKAAEATSTRP